MCMLSQSVPRNARTPFYSFGVRRFLATRLHKQVHVQSIYHLITAWLTGTSLRSQVDYTIIGIIFFDLWELWKHCCKLKFEGGVLDPQQIQLWHDSAKIEWVMEIYLLHSEDHMMFDIIYGITTNDS